VGLGRVAGVHGLQGALKLKADPRAATTDPAVIQALGEVVIGERRYQVLRAERHRRQVLLYLSGVHTRGEAEPLMGQEVLGDRRRFPPLPLGEYWWFQVLGLPVLDAGDGTRLGILTEIIPTPAHDVYVVRQGPREVLIPAVEEVVAEINLEEGWVKVAPPPGLLETYAD
jgi:16S rRNA processing protein RimM